MSRSISYSYFISITNYIAVFKIYRVCFWLCDVIFFTVVACVYCSISFIPLSTPPVVFAPPHLCLTFEPFFLHHHAIYPSEFQYLRWFCLAHLLSLFAFLFDPATHHREVCDLSKRFLIYSSSVGSYLAPSISQFHLFLQMLSYLHYPPVAHTAKHSTNCVIKDVRQLERAQPQQ